MTVDRFLRAFMIPAGSIRYLLHFFVLDSKSYNHT